MPQGKQAKTLTPRQETAVIKFLETTRHPTRDRAMFLLSIKAGLRAKEISSLTWDMITYADGQVGDAIAWRTGPPRVKAAAAPFPSTRCCARNSSACMPNAARRYDRDSP